MVTPLRDWLDTVLINHDLRRQARCPHSSWSLLIESRNRRSTLVSCDRCHAIAEDTQPRTLL